MSGSITMEQPFIAGGPTYVDMPAGRAPGYGNVQYVAAPIDGPPAGGAYVVETDDGEVLVVESRSAWSPVRQWHQRLFVAEGDVDAAAEAEASCWSSSLFCLGLFFLLPNLFNLLFLCSPYRRARIWAYFS
jgi:hypothetical protein